MVGWFVCWFVGLFVVERMPFVGLSVCWSVGWFVGLFVVECILFVGLFVGSTNGTHTGHHQRQWQDNSSSGSGSGSVSSLGGGEYGSVSGVAAAEAEAILASREEASRVESMPCRSSLALSAIRTWERGTVC